MFFRRPDPALFYPPPAAPPSPEAVRLRYLGTAGFVVQAGQHTLVLDPFVSRPGLLAAALRPLVPDAQRIRQVLPQADDVLVGHAHFDHVMDAPVLCQQTGARFIGSRSACNVARAAGLPEQQIVQTQGREDIPSGPGVVRGLPSAHGRVYFGRVTLPGDIPAPPSWPPRMRELRHGQVLNWHVELGGVRIVHIDSAEFFAQELDGLRADVVCLCAIGRAYRPNYVQEIVARLRPSMVVACHWDWFFSPYGRPMGMLPGVDLAGFVAEIRAAGATPVVLPLNGELHIQPAPRAGP